LIDSKLLELITLPWERVLLKETSWCVKKFQTIVEIEESVGPDTQI